MNRTHVAGLMRARALSIYLLSAHATLNAVLAADPEKALHAGAIMAGVLAAALVVGEWIGPWLSGLVEGLIRARLQLAAWIPYGGLLAMACVRLGQADAQSGAEMSIPFLLLQPVFLVLAGLGRGYVGAIQNALVLTVFASLAGGTVAAVAVAGYVGLLGAFLVFDHYARKRLAYAAQAGPGAALAFAQALVLVGAVVAILALVFWVWPPQPYARLAREGSRRTATREQIMGAYRDLVLLAAGGGVAVYLVAYVLLRGRTGESGAEVEVMQARRRGEESVLAVSPWGEVEYSGLRGRIVRAYVRFAARAARLGTRRRPDMTPHEYAARMGDPSAAMAELTDVFERARYGPDEPAEEDARVAERAGEAVLAALRERRSG